MIPGETGLCLEPTLSIPDYRSLGVAGRSYPEFVYHPARDDLRAPLALDPSHVADTVWHLIQSPETLQAMSHAGSRRTEEMFNISQYITHFHALIQESLEA